MRRGLALLGRGAETDDGAAGDQRRLARRLLRRLDRGGDSHWIMTVDLLRMPTRGLETRELVIRHGKTGGSVDRDLVVVEQHDQAAQAQMAGQRDRLLADALHQAAIAGDAIGEMAADRIAVTRVQLTLRQRHADRVGKPLAERTGRRFNARCVAMLGMSGGLGAELTEIADLIDAHAGIAGQMQQRVKQHRAMTGRQHEPVAVGPRRRTGIEFQKSAEQYGRDIGHAHRHAGMPGFGLFDRVHRQRANGVRHVVVTDRGMCWNRCRRHYDALLN